MSKRHSSPAKFSVNGSQKTLIKHRTDHFCKKTQYWEKNLHRDLVARIQADSFKELGVWNWQNENVKKTFSHFWPIKVPTKGTK